MLKSVEGIYRDGKVELLETPEDLEEARVIVTFFPSPGLVDLQARGIDAAQAAALRARLQTFAEDWERPKWRPTIPFRRGEVVLVLFPDSNLRTAKRRPALIVQADNLGTGLAQTLVAMLTSNLTRAGHPSRLTVSLATPAGQQTGLLTDSVIMTDNLATVRESEIDRAIGEWTDMAAIGAALRHPLGW